MIIFPESPSCPHYMFTLSTPAVFGFQPWTEFRFRSVFPLFLSRHSQSRLMSPVPPNCPPLPTNGSILVCEVRLHQSRIRGSHEGP
ncbi:hypothetical protein Pmani_040103 [Petrolisthes manimaculis]|uniref:Uncharacterized protein n=1 Tax=Petrolisthes manimaculis TaxID=1843537 RepID=A0AAE1NBJ4_9EUCA|nr:hypothetical protein Pmani_040103 [Petrolisthes manimaculis]